MGDVRPRPDRRITNPDKVFFPDDGYTKGDLIQFYASIAPVLLPHLARRALSMSRYPDGISGGMFYEKQAPVHTPEWIVTAPIHSTQRGEPIDFVTASDTSSLVWLANMACIEMHPWLSRTGHHGNPDFAVFDLDPMEGATWEQVVHVTKLVNVLLERLGLAGYLKTSGATGIHLYVPIEPEYTYRRVRRFVETLGRMIAGADPENATMEWDIPRRGPRCSSTTTRTSPARPSPRCTRCDPGPGRRCRPRSSGTSSTASVPRCRPWRRCGSGCAATGTCSPRCSPAVSA